MGCIRNQPGKGLPDARGLFAVRAGQPAGEERKSCHCQGPGRGEDKAVPAGGEQGNAHSACGGEHSRQTGSAPVRMAQGSQQDSDGGATALSSTKGFPAGISVVLLGSAGCSGAGDSGSSGDSGTAEVSGSGAVSGAGVTVLLRAAVACGLRWVGHSRAGESELSSESLSSLSSLP